MSYIQLRGGSTRQTTIFTSRKRTEHSYCGAPGDGALSSSPRGSGNYRSVHIVEHPGVFDIILVCLNVNTHSLFQNKERRIPYRPPCQLAIRTKGLGEVRLVSLNKRLSVPAVQHTSYQIGERQDQAARCCLFCFARVLVNKRCIISCPPPTNRFFQLKREKGASPTGATACCVDLLACIPGLDIRCFSFCPRHHFFKLGHRKEQGSNSDAQNFGGRVFFFRVHRTLTLFLAAAASSRPPDQGYFCRISTMFTTCFRQSQTLPRQYFRVPPRFCCRKPRVKGGESCTTSRGERSNMIRLSAGVAGFAVAVSLCFRGGAAQYGSCTNGTVGDIGNGRCDAANNNPSCGFDGGDVSFPD